MKTSKIQYLVTIFVIILFFLIAFSCNSEAPLEKLTRKLANYPEYSIILEDMKTDGNFFKDYYHRYKVVFGESTGIKDSLRYQTRVENWEKVPEKTYKKYGRSLGMVLASRTRDGKTSQSEHPPGYQYVGNPEYGQWKKDEWGNSFWAFYGKFALMNQLFSLFNRPVYQNDWETYRDSQSRKKPYFGPRNEYGTNGNATRRTNPNFFERRQTKERLRKQSFRDKLQQRTRRSNMSGFRSRSRSGFGK